MNSITIQQMIQAGLAGSQVEIHGADGVHFEARVISAVFAGLPLLARHRLVYATLGEHMGSTIHALALRTLTPDEAAASDL